MGKYGLLVDVAQYHYGPKERPGLLFFFRHERDGYWIGHAPIIGSGFHIPIPSSCETLHRLIDAAIADREAVPAYVLAEALWDFLPREPDAARAAELLAQAAA